MTPDEIYRQTAERSISALTRQLKTELDINEAQKAKERKIPTTAAVAVGDGDPEQDYRFVAVNGSPHVMEDLFVELFRKRPDLRWSVQHALDRMFHVEDM